jgi:hypothetical protein
MSAGYKGPALYFALGAGCGVLILSLFGDMFQGMSRTITASHDAKVAVELGNFGNAEPLIADYPIQIGWVPGLDEPEGGWVKSDPVAAAAADLAPVPSLEDSGDELSQLLKKVASDGRMVVATSTDFGYLSMTKNWICHLRKLGLAGKVLVFSLDEKIHQAVLDEGVASYFEKGMSKTGQHDSAVGHWNSKSYNQVVHTKTKHQHAVLKRGYNLFFTDIDIPWLDDYRNQIVRDTPHNVDFVGQQNWPQNDMNVGFFYARRCVQFCPFASGYTGSMLSATQVEADCDQRLFFASFPNNGCCWIHLQRRRTHSRLEFADGDGVDDADGCCVGGSLSSVGPIAFALFATPPTKNVQHSNNGQVLW